MAETTVRVEFERLAARERQRIQGGSLGRQGRFDKKRALEACAAMDRMRESGVFSVQPSGVEVIRAWRNRRR